MIAADAACTILSVAVAVQAVGGRFAALLGPLLLIRLVVFVFGRLNQVPPGRVSLGDLWMLYRLTALSSALMALLMVSALWPGHVSVTAVEFSFAATFMTAWRLAASRRRGSVGAGAARTLILGAGDAGEMIAREMLRNPAAGYLPVGFLDDDPGKHRQRIMGVPVVGPTGRVGEVARRMDATQLVVAIPSATGNQLHRLVELCSASGRSFRLLPPLQEIIGGDAHLGQLRTVGVEDILGRTPVDFPRDSLREEFEGATALVTGGAGSIGSELSAQLWDLGVGKLVVIDRAEAELFYLVHRLAGLRRAGSLVPLVGDVGHKQVVGNALVTHQPQYVFHAAAYKHVPLLEESPGAAVINNVQATAGLLEALMEVPITAFVMLSSDKAANPVSVLGATKRLCELMVTRAASSATCSMASVRFGNVLDSSGSVVPLFRRQIAQGGPVTVTHPEASRYFMTVPEAVNLILHTPGLGGRGEVFLLEMGEPVRILDLAHQMIRLSGLEVGQDVEVAFIGLRPGEKLREELLGPGEEMVDTSQPMIKRAISTQKPRAPTRDQLETLYHTAREGSEVEVIQMLQELLPEYEPKPSLGRTPGRG